MIKLSYKNILISVEIEKPYRKIINDNCADEYKKYDEFLNYYLPEVRKFENDDRISKLIIWDLNTYKMIHTIEGIGVSSKFGLLELPNGKVAVAGYGNLKILDIENYTVIKEIKVEVKELMYNQVKLLLFYNILVFLHFKDIYQISLGNYEIIKLNDIKSCPNFELQTLEISKDFKYAIALDDERELLLCSINYFENIENI